MLQSIDISTILLLFLFGLAVAMLGQAFQAFMGPGQIFNWWAIWLLKMVDKSIEIKEVNKYHGCEDWANCLKRKIKAKWHYRLIAKLAKPLGLCPYCNTTWILIMLFFIYFTPSFNIFLLIGITWFFVYQIEKYK